MNISHAFVNAGTYQVSLTVTDNLGLTNTATKQITVTTSSTGGDIPGDGQSSVDVESNDTPAQANVLASGVALNGSFTSNDNHDYYSIEVSKAGTV